MNARTLRQQALVRSLYRKLLRETQRIPPNASLSHLEHKIGTVQIDNPRNLRSSIQLSFREAAVTSNETDEIKPKDQNNDRIQQALEGLKLLTSLDVCSLEEATSNNVSMQYEVKYPNNNNETQQQHQQSLSLESPVSANVLLDSVDWLPPVSEMNGTPLDTSDFPVFPLSGPLFPDDEGEKLPLLTQFSEVPVHGMEVPLRIFEPRYRQMYRDLLSSNFDSRSFIVPFSHPYRPGQFAEYGWIYEIVRVRDVADQSNGKYQLVCNHLVSKPVKIHEIVNPTDFDTEGSYLRARASIVDTIGYDVKKEGGDEDASRDLKPLEELLKQLQAQPEMMSSKDQKFPVDSFLIDRLLMALGENSIWPVVQVWISNMQTEILRLQMKISTRIQLQASSEQKQSLGNDVKAWEEFVTDDMILLAQAPYKDHLRCMLMEVSTLVPSLLQETSHKAQCQNVLDRIRKRLVQEKDLPNS